MNQAIKIFCGFTLFAHCLSGTYFVRYQTCLQNMSSGKRCAVKTATSTTGGVVWDDTVQGGYCVGGPLQMQCGDENSSYFNNCDDYGFYPGSTERTYNKGTNLYCEVGLPDDERLNGCEFRGKTCDKCQAALRTPISFEILAKYHCPRTQDASNTVCSNLCENIKNQTSQYDPDFCSVKTSEIIGKHEDWVECTISLGT